MSINNITGDKIATRNVTTEYRDNYDAIFRRKLISKGHTKTHVILDEPPFVVNNNQPLPILTNDPTTITNPLTIKDVVEE